LKLTVHKEGLSVRYPKLGNKIPVPEPPVEIGRWNVIFDDEEVIITLYGLYFFFTGRDFVKVLGEIDRVQEILFAPDG
jgi:hypothetical protein